MYLPQLSHGSNNPIAFPIVWTRFQSLISQSAQLNKHHIFFPTTTTIKTPPTRRPQPLLVSITPYHSNHGAETDSAFTSLITTKVNKKPSKNAIIRSLLLCALVIMSPVDIFGHDSCCRNVGTLNRQMRHSHAAKQRIPSAHSIVHNHIIDHQVHIANKDFMHPDAYW